MNVRMTKEAGDLLMSLGFAPGKVAYDIYNAWIGRGSPPEDGVATNIGERLFFGNQRTDQGETDFIVSVMPAEYLDSVEAHYGEDEVPRDDSRGGMDCICSVEAFSWLATLGHNPTKILMLAFEKWNHEADRSPRCDGIHFRVDVFDLYAGVTEGKDGPVFLMMLARKKNRISAHT